MVKKKPLNLYLSDGTIEAICTYAQARGWDPNTSRSRVIEEAIAALTGDSTHICSPITGSATKEDIRQEFIGMKDFLKGMQEEISSVKVRPCIQSRYVCVDYAHDQEETIEKLCAEPKHICAEYTHTEEGSTEGPCAEPKHKLPSGRIPVPGDFVERLKKFTINEISEKTGIAKTTTRDIYTGKTHAILRKNFEALEAFLQEREA